MPLSFALVSMLAASCSLVVDADQEQCTTTLDCQVRGLAFAEAICVDHLCQSDPTWACVDDAVPATQEAMQAPLQVVSFFERDPMVGVRVTLYAGTDLQLADPFDSAETGDEGRATLDVPARFAGFVLLESDGVIDPTLVYPPLPLLPDQGFGQLVAGTAGSINGLIGLVGAVPQENTGTGLVTVRDCAGGGGAGARVVFVGETAGSTPFHTLNGVASASAQELDATGQAGIVNARPGVFAVEVRSDDEVVSSSSIVIRAGHVTQVTLQPGQFGQGFGM